MSFADSRCWSSTSKPVRAVVLVVATLFTSACGGDEGASVDTVPPTSVALSATTVSTTSIAPTSTSSTTTPAFSGDPSFDASSSVSTVGIDRVVFGMTVKQAEQAIEGSLIPVTEAFDTQCYQVRPSGGPAGIEFTVTTGTIERVDLSNPTITTRSGAGVGSTESELVELFGDRVHTESRAGGGNNVIFTPADASDAAFRVIFETDGTKVTRFRSGRVPQVELANPCP